MPNTKYIPQKTETIPGSTKYIEGKTILIVPSDSIETKIHRRAPVFFNPHGKTNRDFSVMICNVESAYAGGGIVYGDVLAGVGARGVRIANEVDGVEMVLLNDLSADVSNYARTSADLNNVTSKCRFSSLDASKFLSNHSSPGERLSFVDVDPFGTPTPYIEPALKSVKNGGILSLTATDTPALCGVYRNVAFRRYGGYSLRTEYCQEIGIRLIIGATVLSCMRLNLGIEPLLSQVIRHYMRVYLRVRAGSRYSERCRTQMGFIEHCMACGERTYGDTIRYNCSLCNGKTKFAGPLWLGPIFSSDYLDKSLSILTNISERYHKMLFTAKNEAMLPPTFYVTDSIADGLEIQAPAPMEIISDLTARGFLASRTSLNPKGLRSSAPFEVVRDVLSSLSKKQ